MYYVRQCTTGSMGALQHLVPTGPGRPRAKSQWGQQMRAVPTIVRVSAFRMACKALFS